MKSISFDDEFIVPILRGEKRFTSRLSVRDLKVGDVVNAKVNLGWSPFATLKITSIQVIPWHEFTDDDAADCGVTRGWYERKRPFIQPFDPIYKIGFEVIKPGGEK